MGDKCYVKLLAGTWLWKISAQLAINIDSKVKKQNKTWFPPCLPQGPLYHATRSPKIKLFST